MSVPNPLLLILQALKIGLAEIIEGLLLHVFPMRLSFLKLYRMDIPGS
jgi:hypothetical protein